MNELFSETIAALATAPVPSGVAVIRLSGPAAARVLRKCFIAKTDPTVHPRQLTLGNFCDAEGTVLDRCLAVFMPGPNSYTGDDVVEFQVHGSPILARKILQTLFALGCTPAEPGEFTKRAFLNGKLDLSQAEAVSDLIEAGSERAAQIAGENLEGKLSSVIHEIGEPLRDVLAELEASLDFPEEDIQPDTVSKFREDFTKARIRIDEMVGGFDSGGILKEGFRVLICGPPNAGKSSLLNSFLRKRRAIVSPISGTTRDLIEESCLLGSHHLVFCDSAGITESDDEIESTGIELAVERLSWADLVLLVIDGSDVETSWQEVLHRIQDKAENIWLIVNKIDLNPDAIGTIYCDPQICRRNLYISVESAEGIDELQKALLDEIEGRLPSLSESNVLLTHERHRNALARASESLKQAQDALSATLPLEVVSSALRSALNDLGEIIGETYTEDLLGRIFSKFCIGK